MTDRELMQQALKCTPHKQLIDELLDSRIAKTEREHAAAREIEELRERLAQPERNPEQEPVAWRNVIPGGCKTDEWDSARVADYNQGWNDYRKAAKAALEKLYTAPLRREWFSLTDDERLEAAGIDGADEWFWKAVEAIEAKLKEKNT